MESLLEIEPKIKPPLDPGYRPAFLGNRNFAEAVKKSGQGVPLKFALARSGGQVVIYATKTFPEGHPESEAAYRHAERILKFLLWQKGGSWVYVCGPASITRQLGNDYFTTGTRAFDADFMANVYQAPRFGLVAVEEKEFPLRYEDPTSIGRHLEGCRIGFDAGGSDRKVAAVIDGKEVFTCEVGWEPKVNSDPQYHFDGIDDSIRQAAKHLPRIDAIGVSSAGIFIENKTRVASLFRKVPAVLFEKRIKNIYMDIAKKWGNVPIEVANDGDVTALAGAMSLNDQPVLGIAWAPARPWVTWTKKGASPAG